MGSHRRTTPEPPPFGAAGRHRRARRSAVPVRTGLLGVSAAMAMGALAMASGLLPGDGYTMGPGSPGGGLRAGGLPDVEPQGTTSSSSPVGQSSDPARRGTDRSSSPTALPSRTHKDQSSATPSQQPPGESSGTPRPSATPAPSTPKRTPKAPDPETTAETAILSLVNQERTQAGCRPVQADPELAVLAGDFSEDMAKRDFFDHTDPDGASPWDRADEAGISNLGGENIARGQPDAQAVMDTWMDSPGHRTNILNCDFTTLGVGAHFGTGGPWWTQDFGY